MDGGVEGMALVRGEGGRRAHKGGRCAQSSLLQGALGRPSPRLTTRTHHIHMHLASGGGEVDIGSLD